MQKDMKRLIYILIIALFVISSGAYGQNKRSIIPRDHFREKTEQRNFPLPEVEFENVIDGLNTGNIAQISRYFSSQVYLSLRSGERGYYSNNQAYYLIDNFFRIYAPISFQTTSRMMESNTPYLAGKLFCRFKGSIEVFQLYLSLYWNGYRWEITQISIN